MLLVVMSAVFGGASREAPIRLMAVELSSLPLLFLSLRALAARRLWQGRTLAFAVLALTLLIPALQLIPLPPNIWAALPGRRSLAQGLEAAGLPAPWLPATLTPSDTWRSLLALAPPVAMFLGALAMAPLQLRRLAGLWIGFGFLGLAIGAGQMFAGRGSAFWLYETTNYGSLVGFFANRNHQASFLLGLTAFAAAFAARGLFRREAQGVAPLIGALFLLIAIAGLAAVKSRAGAILGVPALAATLALVWRSAAAPRRMRTGLAVTVVAVLGVGAVGLFGLAPLLERFDDDGRPEVRAQAWPYVQRAADQFLPIGSGVGSFDTVFRAVEPLDLVSEFYVNHVHNDYLETWLETGWLGAAAVFLFFVWFWPLAMRAWRTRDGPDPDLARAASIAIALSLAHAFVDYALRTTAMSTLFAFSCGALALLAAPSASRARSG